MNSNEDLKGLAIKYAEKAAKFSFHRRYGTCSVTEFKPRRLCYFNNNPYKGSMTRRDREREKLVNRLAEIGIATLAYGEWPTSGPDEGYSFALILDTSPKNGNLVYDMWTAIIVEESRENENNGEFV